jgi:hypothetical protein
MARKIFVFQLLGLMEDKKKKPIACSNLRILHERSGIGYDNLVRIFTRNGRSFYMNDRIVIMKIYESNILRGGQTFSVRNVYGRPFAKKDNY